MNRQTYTGRELALLVPTKDRPHKLAALLDSIAQQGVAVGRILIVDGGEGVEDVVARHAPCLPVEHHKCMPPGQIRQRNLGISLLDDRTPLVLCLDDDIVLEPGALSAMVDFWSQCEPETAAVSCNVVNAPPEPRSRWRTLLGMGASEGGRVLRSGMSSAYSPAACDRRTEWVCGGATVWRTRILRDFPHKEIPARWAIGEDLIFSYPIGKRFPLYVCAGARVRHEHQADYVWSMKHRFHGRIQTMWLFYFVESNVDLSRLAFLWMMSGRILARFAAGVLTLRAHHLEFALGQIEGLATGFRALLRGAEMSTILHDSQTR